MASEHRRRARLARLEQQYEAAPGAYRIGLGLLAALGVVVLGGVLLLSVGLTLTLLGLLMTRPLEDARVVIPIIVLGLVAVSLLRALWFRFEPPSGHALEPDQAPVLREEVERIRSALGAQRLDGIIIDDHLNAAAAYVPTGWGLLRQRHYLVIGLPLLQVLDRQELAAIIAHEFGHFHKGHGRFGAWIYRLRVSWQRVLEALAYRGGSLFLLFWFVRWYVPCFEQRSLVLARRQEYAADAVAAQIVGAPVVASALARVHLAMQGVDDRFWPQVWRSAQAQAYPPVQVYARLAQVLADERGQSRRLPFWVHDEAVDIDDSHPSLVQRFAALGVNLDLPLQTQTAAAAAQMLGADLLERLQQQFSQQWQQAAKPDWEAAYQQAQQAQQRLQVLEQAAQRTPAQWLEYASLLEACRSDEQALPAYQQGAQQMPADASAQGRLGMCLLRLGQPQAGLEHLHRAMRLDPALTPILRVELDAYLRTLPDAPDWLSLAQPLRQPDAAGMDGDAAAVPGPDEFQPHALEAATLQALCRALAGHERIAVAWLVRQQVSGLSVLPHYLLLLEWAGSHASETAALPRLREQVKLPGTFNLLTTTERTPVLRRMRSHVGEPIYRRR